MSVSRDVNNVSVQQSTASYSAAARLASATPPPAHILSRGIGWQVNITYLRALVILFFSVLNAVQN